MALTSGCLLALSSPATAEVVTPSRSPTAQTATPSTPASSSARAYFPATGFRVADPAFLSYFQQAGGVRTFGYPVSNDFQFLGTRVQIFQRGVLQAGPDGSMGTMSLLADDMLPLVGASGATFPAADPDLVAASPIRASDDYVDQALSFVATNVPDTWNDLPVNFLTTFQNTVTCDDLGPGATCDDRTLGSRALDTWGLPTSAPAADPDHPDFVYQRFERGILQYSRTTGVTQWLLIGELFREVLSGTDLPSDVQAQVADSRFYAQYDSASGSGPKRPDELPSTRLTGAFTPQPAQASNGALPTGARPTVVARARPGRSSDDPSGLLTSGSGQTDPDEPAAMPQTTVQPAGRLATATPASGRASAGQVGSFGRAFAGVVAPSPPTDADPDPPLAVPTPTPTSSLVAAGASSPKSAAPAAPIGPDPCAGDEQILFAPLKPYVGSDVLVAATSATHHDVRTVRLTGPVQTGPVNERPGLSGWVWEWTITPSIAGRYDFTFYADGARACATAGFNAAPAFGAPSAPTPPIGAIASSAPPAAPMPTPIPTPTVAASATPLPPPSLSTTPAEPACGAAPGRLLTLHGANFGASQAASKGTVLFAGAGATHTANTLSWTNDAILVVVPTGLPSGAYELDVTTSTGATAPVTYHVGSC